MSNLPDNAPHNALRRACSKGEPILERPSAEALAARACADYLEALAHGATPQEREDCLRGHLEGLAPFAAALVGFRLAQATRATSSGDRQSSVVYALGGLTDSNAK